MAARGARSGANASFVTSPAHTRSHSAVLELLGAGADSSASRSVKQHGAPAPAASRSAAWAGSAGGSDRAVRFVAAGPSAGRVVAEVQRHACRSRAPARRPPTQTTSPEAQSAGRARRVKWHFEIKRARAELQPAALAALPSPEAAR